MKISNPAFDVTDAELVRGIICERGVLAPSVLAGMMYEELGIAKKNEKNFSLIAMLKK